MSKFAKLLAKILSAHGDKNVNFDDLCHLLFKLGFDSRIKGSHHIFYRKDLAEIINIQEQNGKAKPYQVKQGRELILKYNLSIENEES